MAQLLAFPQSVNKPDPLDEAMDRAMKNIEDRFGVSFWDYMKGSDRSPDVQDKINRALQKETLYYASKE